MPYSAKQLVRFDREYAIGETIPDAVVDSGRAESLIAMGRITRIYDAAQESPMAPQEAQETHQEADVSEVEVNTTEEDENATGEEAETSSQAKKPRGKK